MEFDYAITPGAYMKLRKSACFLGVVLLALAGCATVPMANVANDTAAKRFAPTEGQAVVYIYRNETLGAAIKMEVAVDRKPVGQTAAHTYFRLVLPPGRHVIVSQGDTEKALVFEAKPDQVYYVWQEVKMGIFYANSALHLVGINEGQAGVLECKLAASAN